MTLDHLLGQSFPHPKQIRTPDAVLEPAQRGLRGQIILAKGELSGVQGGTNSMQILRVRRAGS